MLRRPRCTRHRRHRRRCGSSFFSRASNRGEPGTTIASGSSSSSSDSGILRRLDASRAGGHAFCGVSAGSGDRGGRRIDPGLMSRDRRGGGAPTSPFWWVNLNVCHPLNDFRDKILKITAQWSIDCSITRYKLKCLQCVVEATKNDFCGTVYIL